MEAKPMTKIIISIVSVLLILFPFSSTLLGTYQQLTFPGVQEVTNDIVDAIKSNDIQAIEEMLSKEAKQRMGDPQKSISEFLQTIDGEIVDARQVGGGGESSESGSGYVYKVKTWTVEVNTPQNTYLLSITWIISDTRSPQHVGLSSMFFANREHEILAELYA